MDTAKCYEAFGGDYEDVLQRIPGSPLVEKFLGKFLDDKSFDELCSCMENGDCKGAFSAAHTLKGVSANLGITSLFKSADVLTENLRNTDGNIPEEAYILFEDVKSVYEMVVNTIREFGEF